MREIIPLKKDIIFKTMIGMITNIDVSHDYKVKDDIVEGQLLVSGSYKMTEASVLEEDFYYKIPFSLAISKRIKKDTINIEIDDFRYETNKDVMSIEADLEFTCDEEVEDKEDDFMKDYFNDKEEINNEETVNLEENDVDINNEKDIELENEKNNINIEENINNITNTIVNNDNKYYTYKIYIVRNGDTIESICTKYNVTLEDLKEYNDLTEIKEGDKIIIPSINE